MNHLINAWPNGAWSAVRDPDTKRWHLTNDNVRDNEVKVNHYSRKAGASRYGFLRIVQYSLDFMLHCPSRKRQ